MAEEFNHELLCVLSGFGGQGLLFAGKVLANTGLIDGRHVGAEAGFRFGWKGSRRLSGLDFGVGCQVFRDGFVPTVEVGLYIWGVPVLCGLCLVMGALQ